MGALPVQYMKIIQHLTGFWGTYLPTRLLAPGMIGVAVDGKFEHETHLEKFIGYDPKNFTLDEYTADDSVLEWRTEGVTLGSLAPSVEIAGAPVKVGFELHFNQGNDALLLCLDVKHQLYSDMRVVKKYLYELKQKGLWQPEYCLVTEVVIARSAWVFFATEHSQSATIEAHVSALPEGAPASLKALFGSADAGSSFVCKNFNGFSVALPTGGTPLFSALRFRRDWWQLGLGEPKISFLKGANDIFEEASFGA